MPGDELDHSDANPEGSHPWVHHDARLPIDPDLSPDDPGEPSFLHHPIAHVHRARQRIVLLAIALGGFIGALGRYELSLAWRTPTGHMPWATFTINTSGGFLLGVTLTVLLSGSRPPTYLRPFICVGILGSWTTMSTFAGETDLLIRNGSVATAVAYVSATVVVGLAVTWLGVAAGRALAAGRVARWV